MAAWLLDLRSPGARYASNGESIMILQIRDPRSRRGNMLAEQAFILAAIGIALVVIARMGFEMSGMFDQLSLRLPAVSDGGSPGRQPARKRGKRPPAPPAMAGATGTPRPASATPARKVSRGKAPGSRRGPGGGGIGTSKRAADDERGGSVSYGVTSSSSGVLSILIGG